MAGGFRAPGIRRIETDVSEVVRPVGTSIGAIIAPANKGPVNRRILITSDKNFIDTFGEPTCAATDMAHYAALDFLTESGAMWVVRPSGGDEKYSSLFINATGNSYTAPFTSGITTNDTTATLAANGYSDGNTTKRINGQGGIYDIDSISLGVSALAVAALGPGTYGSDISISIVTCADTNFRDQYGMNWETKYDEPNDVNWNWSAGSKTGTLSE